MTSTKARIWLPVLLSLGLCTPAGAAATDTEEGEKVARVVDLRGQVEVLPVAGGEWQPLEAGRELAAGDQVRTGKRSRVVLALGDKIEVRLTSNSQLEVHKPEPATGERSLGLVVGSLLARVTRIGHGGTPFAVYGPTAVAGVRGTVFTVAVADDGAQLTSVSEGRVALAGEQELLLEAGQAAAVEQEGQAPQKLSEPVAPATWLVRRRERMAARAEQLAGRWQQRLAEAEESLQQRLQRVQVLHRRLAGLGRRLARARRAGRLAEMERLTPRLLEVMQQLGRQRFKLRRRALWLQSRLLLLERLQQLPQLDGDARLRVGRLASKVRARARRLRQVHRGALVGLRQTLRQEQRLLNTWKFLHRGLTPAQRRALIRKLRRRAR